MSAYFGDLVDKIYSITTKCTSKYWDSASLSTCLSLCNQNSALILALESFNSTILCLWNTSFCNMISSRYLVAFQICIRSSTWIVSQVYFKLRFESSIFWGAFRSSRSFEQTISSCPLWKKSTDSSVFVPTTFFICPTFLSF